MKGSCPAKPGGKAVGLKSRRDYARLIGAAVGRLTRKDGIITDPELKDRSRHAVARGRGPPDLCLVGRALLEQSPGRSPGCCLQLSSKGSALTGGMAHRLERFTTWPFAGSLPPLPEGAGSGGSLSGRGGGRGAVPGSVRLVGVFLTL